MALDEEDTKVTPDLLPAVLPPGQELRREDPEPARQVLPLRAIRRALAHGRLDKIDFLLARLSEESTTARASWCCATTTPERDLPGDLGAARRGAPGDQLVEERRARSTAVRHAMGGLESLDQLNETALIRRYRELKHGLGQPLLPPRAAARRPGDQPGASRAASRSSTARRSSGSRRVPARLRARARGALRHPTSTRELAAFREEIERFEKQLQREEFRLGDIARSARSA